MRCKNAALLVCAFSWIAFTGCHDRSIERQDAPQTGALRSNEPQQNVAHANEAGDPNFWAMADVPCDEAAERLFSAMTADERLAQLFMLAYAGTKPTPLLLDWIERRGLGGVKVFGWNAVDTDVLADAIRIIQHRGIKSRFSIPPFIATDQEGGWIRHVRGATSVTPGNMAIGASGWPSDAYNSAYYIGKELAALGISMNFAPTVDLATMPESTIIGPRAFSADPADTAVLAAAWVRGMSDAGIFCTAKHYPGHGDTELDSHGVLPVIRIDETTLWNRELVPYRLLIKEGVPGIMSAHLSFPEVTGDALPASLSKKLIGDMLRTRLQYDGIVVTDDLMMTGAALAGGIAQTCELAIRAGNDIIMFSRTLGFDDFVWKRLKALYEDDASFKSRVDESARRVLRAKLRWLLPKTSLGIIPARDVNAQLRTQESRDFFAQQALRSATLISDVGLPLEVKGRILMAAPFGEFFAEGRKRFAARNGKSVALTDFRFSYMPGAKAFQSELHTFTRMLAAFDTIIVCVADPAGAAFARAAAQAGKKLYVVSVLNPLHALEFKKAGTVAVYSYAAESFAAAFAILFGDIEATGRLPFAWDGK